MTAAPRPAPRLPDLTFVQHLGSGGYADVFLYEQSQPVRRNVAVKVLHADDLDDEVQRNFENEANTMAQLSDHPFIVPVMWANVTDDGRPYIVMKYYPKPNMAVRARREQFSVASVLRIGIQISSAVETAHRARILHRDIKPHNILTDHYGDPALSDFGIAATTADTVTASGGMSVPWSPPEILRGTTDGDERSDVYSLGATLWHLLVGHAPYELAGHNGQWEHSKRIQHDAVPPIPRKDVPASLQSVVKQMLAKSPNGRPRSALAVARELQAIEQECRLPPTRIVVPDPPGAGEHVLDEDGEEEATWKRSIRIIEAQLEGQTVTRPRRPVASSGDGEAPADGPAAGGRPRVAPPAPPEEPTIKRPPTTTAESTAGNAAEDPVGSRRRGRLVGSLVAVVVVLLAGGVTTVLTAGADPEVTDAAEPRAEESAVALVIPKPDTPRVTVRKAGRRVRFTLAYDDKLPGDEFRWRHQTLAGTRRSSPAYTTTTRAYHEVAVPRGAQVCVTVEVVRGSTNEPSNPSAKECSR